MSAEYTPDTDEVRIKYRASSLEQPGDDSEFDRWLDQVRAEAWDEGHSDGRHNEHEFREGRKITNPYRAV